MKLKALKCPNCDGNLDVEDGLDTFFCKYCGYKIVVSDMSSAAYRAKTKAKEMEHNERMADKAYQNEEKIREQVIEHENKRIKMEKWKMIIRFLGISLLFIVPFFLLIGIGIFEKVESDNQEKELEKIVEEINVDIENEDFDNARVKAESIQYTVSYSSETKEKWENTKEQIIKRIDKAEKEAKKVEKQKQKEQERKEIEENGNWVDKTTYWLNPFHWFN